MNRFAFGLSLLVLAPLGGGCGLYISNPPDPDPTPRPPKKPLEFPFDAAQGVGLVGAPTDKGLAMNGLPNFPTAFRAADVVFAPRSSSDTANFTPLLVLQSTSTDAAGNIVPGVADVNNPVRLAGVIVPAPNTPGYEEALQATRNWAQGQPLVVGAPGAKLTSGATPSPGAKLTPGVAPIAGATPGAAPLARRGQTATATISVVPAPGGRARATGTAAPVPVYVPSQSLDVFEDPKYPIDSENRKLVEVFFKSVNATKAVPSGTVLSLNRMLIRSGWAVVDLYSPTAFDQQSWLLDESYARRRKLGLWRYGVALQQRVPEFSTGTGAQSSISVITGSGAPSGTIAVPGAGRAVRGRATTAFPRTQAGSGSRVQRGRSSIAVLPLPAPAGGASTSAVSPGSAPGDLSNSASGSSPIGNSVPSR